MVLDEANTAFYHKMLSNNLTLKLQQLAVFGDDIVAIAVESAFNWYWLVDGLTAAGCNRSNRPARGNH